MNVSFSSISSPDEAANLSGFRPNSIISFGDFENATFKIDRQDNAKSQAAALNEADLETRGFVCFRRDNKIAITIGLKLDSTELEKNNKPRSIKCAFEMKYSNANANLEIPTTMPTTPTSATSTPTQVTPTQAPPQVPIASTPISHKIFIDFGPVTFDEGLKVVQTPKYIEDCLNSSTKNKT
jgi:hypothetical protein